MSKPQRSSGTTKQNNISSKLLGAKVSDIKIEKFRDLTQYHKDKYELAGKFSIPILKTITNKFSPQVIFTIVLPNQAISSIDVLSECTNLIILNLSHNSIENISCLQSCPQLRIANLADNSINNLDGLGKCHELVNLHLEGNMIKGVGQIQSLKQCEKLRNLHLQTLAGDGENPICSLNMYRENVLDLLSQLKRLDSIPRGASFHNGSELKTVKKKQAKIDLKSINPYFMQKFPSQPYVAPSFTQEQSLKSSINSCKSSISELEIKIKAALAL